MGVGVCGGVSFNLSLCLFCVRLQFSECPWEGAASLLSRDAAGPQTKDRMILGAGGACTH